MNFPSSRPERTSLVEIKATISVRQSADVFRIDMGSYDVLYCSPR